MLKLNIVLLLLRFVTIYGNITLHRNLNDFTVVNFINIVFFYFFLLNTTSGSFSFIEMELFVNKNKLILAEKI